VPGWYRRKNRGAYLPEYDYLNRLGNLVACWDFAVGVTEDTEDGGVASIADLSGRGNTLTAPGASNRPAYTPSNANFNGQPTGTGDGTDDSLLRSVMSFGAALGPASVLVVGKIEGSVVGEPFLSYRVNDVLVREGASQRVETFFMTGSRVTTTGVQARAHVIAEVADGSNLSLYVDGAQDGASTPYTGTVADGGALRLFARSDGFGPANVTIAFAAISLSAWTPQQVADFGAYARVRWGTP